MLSNENAKDGLVIDQKKNPWHQYTNRNKMKLGKNVATLT